MDQPNSQNSRWDEVEEHDEEALKKGSSYLHPLALIMAVFSAYLCFLGLRLTLDATTAGVIAAANCGLQAVTVSYALYAVPRAVGRRSSS